jgi:hypothetical protein
MQGWIEFKKTHVYAVEIRPLQVAWLTRRYRLNKRSFIGVRRMPASKRESGADELWLMPGCEATALQQSGLQAVHALCWGGGPSMWNWLEIAEALRKGL